ncbi:MAG: hypothetical protein LBH09_01005 [Peptococcaceae bacterium]|jgi:hypothetical protein|nr:hypothetical protein [Peptococcaceae bacterium]
MAINPLSVSSQSMMYGSAYTTNRNTYLPNNTLNANLTNYTVSMLEDLNSLNGLSSINSVSNLSSMSQNALQSLYDLNKLIYSPGYQINSSESSDSAKNYLTTIKAASNTIKNSLRNLMGTSGPSVYSQTNPVSSDTKKLTLDLSGMKPGANLNGVSVQIDQIASRQVNQGAAMAANAKAGGPGLYEFSIQNDGNTYQFSVMTDAGDTNKSLQDKIAAAINGKGIGVSAFVEHDAKTKTSVLTIQSKGTGGDARNQFTVQDIYGNAIGLTGAGAVSRQAQDALYRVGSGELQSSKSNTIDLGYGIKATMLEASDKPVEVSMKPDGTSALGSLNAMVTAYNSLIDAAKSSDKGKALQLNYQLALTTNTYINSLNRIGITMGTDGKMSVNEDKFNSASASGEVESFFNTGRNANYGFANRLYNLASDISTKPMKYTDLSSLGIYNYTNTLYSPYQALSINRSVNTGLFLNMFV